MRKLLLLTITLFSLMTYAQTVEKTYIIENPDFIKSGNYDLLKNKDMILAGPAGSPALPYHSISLLLPPGHEAISITIEGIDKEKLVGNYYLYPMQYSRPISEGGDAIFTKNEEIYKSDAIFPSTPNGELITEYQNGFSYALSTFTPYEYIPATGELFVYNKVKVSIETKESAVAMKALQNFKSNVKNELAQNQENIDLYSGIASKDLEDGTFTILLITSSEYQNYFVAYRNMYLQKGYITEIKTIHQIQNEYEGIDLAERIRNCIIDYYQEYNLSHVVLGGDVEIVPHRGFYCEVQSSSLYTDDDIPSDLYYSSLDGSWDEDGDGLYGEVGEDDLLPEVSVARMSFSNEQELNAITSKTIKYQTVPVLGELTTPLFAGENLYWDPETWGSDFLELQIGYRDDNGYTTNGIPEDYPVQKLYELNTSWGGQDLMDQVNDGRPLLYHAGHASPGSVMHLSTSDITNENFFAANGTDHNFTVVYTHGCDCGSFDNTDCIAEHMVKINNFAAAFVGNSRYGWFNEGQTEGPSQHIHREFTDAAYGNNNTQIGAAHMESKAETAPFVTAPGQWEEGAQRWCFYDCNVLGDPAMSLWTREPFSVTADYEQAIAIGTTELPMTISGDGILENLRVAAIHQNQLVGFGLVDDLGNTTVEFYEPMNSLGEIYLVVSGANVLNTVFECIVIPEEGPYVIYSDYDAQNVSGSEVIFGNDESVILDVEMKNVGFEDAHNVEVSLTSENAYIDITDDEEGYGNMESGVSVMETMAFSFDIINGIPDQSSVDLIFEAQSDEGSWESILNVIVQAPNLVSTGIIDIDDEDNGNGNGFLDPGETVVMSFEVENNGHRPSGDLIATLSTPDDYITIIDSEFEGDALDVNETIMCVFTVQVDENAMYRDVVQFYLSCTDGAYTAQNFYDLNIGLIMEDFESGDFTAFDWINDIDTPWVITEQNVYEGTYSARSGSIEDNATSTLMIEVNVIADDSISFFRKVSSEQSYDFLVFYIDDQKIAEWSGEQGWTKMTYALDAGNHVLKWVYEKDSMISSGEDCAWLDNITFPALALGVDVKPVFSTNRNVNVYPNPSTGLISIKTQNINDEAIIQVYTPSGQIMISDVLGSSNKLINLERFGAGMYIIRLIDNTEVYDTKVIIQ
jgi:hypothetical protein